MEKKTSLKIICNTIIKKKILRVLSSLILICVLFIVISLGIGNHFKNKIIAGKNEIEKNTKLLSELQNLAKGKPSKKAGDDTISKKQFAEYDEVVPFITFLESIFTLIDPGIQISIKSGDEAISINHFADYKISLKTDQKKELFFKALDELYNSSFITKFMDFSIGYKTMGEGEAAQLSDVNFTVRLFLK
jgi:hypothetical protein